MTKEEIYLKTIFCCMVCDGDIEDEEIQEVKDLCAKEEVFGSMDVEKYINEWILELNKDGAAFRQHYFEQLSALNLTKEEQMIVVTLAIKTIDADNVVEYSEVKFFKKIRMRLSLTDDEILKQFPGREDLLTMDINEAETHSWSDDVCFLKIHLNDEK